MTLDDRKTKRQKDEKAKKKYKETKIWKRQKDEETEKFETQLQKKTKKD